jgi:hypothetical protein
VLAIEDGREIGDICTYIGMSDSRTVTIKNGANTDLGEDRILGLNDSVTVVWNGSYWVERFN